MLELESEQPASKVCAEVIHHGHDQIEGEKQREEAVFQEETDGDLDLLAEAAGPDIPQDDRLPDVHLPPVESVGASVKSPCRIIGFLSINQIGNSYHF